MSLDSSTLITVCCWVTLLSRHRLVQLLCTSCRGYCLPAFRHFQYYYYYYYSTILLEQRQPGMQRISSVHWGFLLITTCITQSQQCLSNVYTASSSTLLVTLWRVNRVTSLLHDSRSPEKYRTCPTLPYSERLKACQIPTLHYRRIRGDMIETYKIITGKYQGCVATSLIKEETYVTRGNDFRLQKLRVRYDLRKFVFFSIE